MTTKLINLTPHDIHVHHPDGRVLTIHTVSGVRIPRVAMDTRVVGDVAGIPIRVSVPGTVLDLPAPEPGNVYICSMIVVQAAHRADVVAPDDAVRDSQGRIVGCRAFAAAAVG